MDLVFERVKFHIVPLLKTGVNSGSIELEARDCSALLFVLKTSVPLGPFLELFTDILKNTVVTDTVVTDDEEKS